MTINTLSPFERGSWLLSLQTQKIHAPRGKDWYHLEETLKQGYVIFYDDVLTSVEEEVPQISDLYEQHTLFTYFDAKELSLEESSKILNILDMFEGIQYSLLSTGTKPEIYGNPYNLCFRGFGLEEECKYLNFATHFMYCLGGGIDRRYPEVCQYPDPVTAWSKLRQRHNVMPTYERMLDTVAGFKRLGALKFNFNRTELQSLSDSGVLI